MSKMVNLGGGSCLLLVLAVSLPAQSPARRDWEAFRNAYPYHIQVVATGDLQPDGGRTLIVSEPPPQVSAIALRELDPALLSNVTLMKERVGFDGWVEDAVFELPRMEDGQFQELVAKLHLRLFGTAYKAVAVEIPSSPRKNAGYQLDLHVPSSSLAKWLLGERSRSSGGWFTTVVFLLLALWGLKVFGRQRKLRHVLALGIGGIGLWVRFTPDFGPSAADTVRFIAANGGKARTCREILSSNTAGVFLSEKPGLVLWSFARRSPLDSQSREARRFALDSDVLLGAIGSRDQVAVIARERVAPISVLPPLRTETILQLAAVQDGELSQSYERNDFVAGRFDLRDGDRQVVVAGQAISAKNDWAPIYLSRQLIDTEYGSLLNITDQLLKSWSMHGLVKYVNFPYPEPGAYPFPEALSEHAHAKSVLFNWNTKGAGYSAASGDLDVFAWNRTGALPVDYFGDGDAKLREAEEVGYEYFAKRNDPNLVRVVQYAELYQVFRHFGVTAQGPAVAMAVQPVPGRVFRGELLSLMRRFIEVRLAPAAPEEIVALKDGLGEYAETYGDAGLVELADAIADPRVERRRLSGARGEAIDKLVAGFQRHKYALMRLAGLDAVTAAEMFIRSSAHRTAGWIHTPSVVVSMVDDPNMPNATGGHNLDSAITTFRASSDVDAGNVKIVMEEGKRVVLYNDADAEKIPETVRAAARTSEDAETLKLGVERDLKNAHVDGRPMPAALGFTETVKPSGNRGMQLPHVDTASDRTGWWVRSTPVTEKQAGLLGALNGQGAHTIVIERTQAGSYYLYDGPAQKIIEAGNRPAAIDAMLTSMNGGKSSGPVRLHLRGFDPREGRGFTKSAELQLAGMGGGERPITATLEREPLNPEELKAMLSEKYKFAEIKVTKVSEPFKTERGETAVDVEAHVKPVSGVKALVLRIRVVLREGVQMTAELLHAITTRISTAFRMGEIHDGSILLTSTLLRDLERISPDIKYVEGRVARESKDLHIVDNRTPGRDTGTAIKAA